MSLLHGLINHSPCVEHWPPWNMALNTNIIICSRRNAQNCYFKTEISIRFIKEATRSIMAAFNTLDIQHYWISTNILMFNISVLKFKYNPEIFIRLIDGEMSSFENYYNQQIQLIPNHCKCIKVTPGTWLKIDRSMKL